MQFEKLDLRGSLERRELVEMQATISPDQEEKAFGWG